MRRAELQARVGTVVAGKWKLAALIGVGGMAAVYRAVHRNGHVVAVKVMHRAVLQHDNLVERFLQEGRVANLIHHPAVVPVIDDGHLPDGAPYLVMEYLDGEAYDAFVGVHGGRAPRRRIEEPEAAFVFAQVTAVLVQAEELRLIHRDIKPANLFRVVDGSVRLLDFGIARLLAEPISSGTATGMAVGTPAYMPPEQARGRTELVGSHSDQFSLAATILTLLVGRKLRRAETNAEEFAIAMMQPFPKASAAGLEIRPAFGEILDRALSFDISERFPSAASMKSALERAFPEYVDGKAPSIERTYTEQRASVPSMTLQGFAPVDSVADIGRIAAPRVEALPDLRAALSRSSEPHLLPPLASPKKAALRPISLAALVGSATLIALLFARPALKSHASNVAGNVLRRAATTSSAALAVAPAQAGSPVPSAVALQSLTTDDSAVDAGPWRAASADAALRVAPSSPAKAPLQSAPIPATSGRLRSGVSPAGGKIVPNTGTPDPFDSYH